MATLTGKLADVTNKTPENISSITVKAPSVRIGGGTEVITSSPAKVEFNRTTGSITISDLTGGLSWIFIEGDGWSDSIALSVAEGMTTLVEAIANASGVPGMVDYLALLNGLDGAAEASVDRVIDGLDLVKGSDPRVPTVDNSPGISWAVTDGEFAALATTTAGAVDIRRATPGAAKAVLDAAGSDPRVPTLGDVAGLAWAVTDADHAALAVTAGGEVDFGRLTDRAKSAIGGVDGVSATTAWVVSTDGGEAHATYLPTGQRIHVSDAESWIEASGSALTYDAGGKTVWRKTPTDGPWEAASVDRFAWWGSSTMRGFNAGMFDLFAAKGIPESNYFDGGIGSDRAAHILGRMGVEPFKLASSVTFPASQMTNSVYFEIAGVTPTVSLSHTWGHWGDIYGRLSMIDSQWRFTPQSLSAARTLPAGTEFTPDAATLFRDAVTIVNIGKNDFVGEGKDAQFIFNETKKATDWLRSLARHHLVFGHFSNTNWDAGDPRIAGIDEANRLCKEHYGARYIDLNAYILGDQVWSDFGVTPTADDLAAQSRRVLPPSLSANANHFSSEFNLVLVDKLIRPALESKGWL